MISEFMGVFPFRLATADAIPRASRVIVMFSNQEVALADIRSTLAVVFILVDFLAVSAVAQFVADQFAHFPDAYAKGPII
jgi:hypothetical protein